MNELKELFCRLKGRISSAYDRLRKKKQNKDYSSETLPPTKSAMESITTHVIDETLSESSPLWNAFLTRISSYDADENPIGEDAAKETMFWLLEAAVSGQNTLADRVVEAASTSTNRARLQARSKGVNLPDLMAPYNERLSEIYTLANEAVEAKRQLDVARGPYEKESDHLTEVINFTRENRRKQREGEKKV